jgi:hypothetical protein
VTMEQCLEINNTTGSVSGLNISVDQCIVEVDSTEC